MNPECKLSSLEAEEMIRSLKEVFPIVRIFNEEMLESIKLARKGKDGQTKCYCYTFWQRETPCQNCISLQAFAEKGQKTKLEYVDDHIYEVIAKYVEVEGEPYIIEMIHSIDDRFLEDTGMNENLLQRFTSYNSKLYRDVLTDAYNRRYYEEKMKNERFNNCGVAFMDLDDFKKYNDLFGHGVGDQALITLTRVIQQSIRKTDQFIRLAGDEFVLIMPNIDSHEFTSKVIHLQELINHATVPGSSSIQLSVSIGGVFCHNETIGEALKRSDQLMYEAKGEGNVIVIERQNNIYHTRVNALSKDEEKQLILIVDDSEMNREILSEILKEDYRILEACNGDECIHLLEEQGKNINLILLDIVMPGKDGFDFLLYMNKEALIEDIPVIMISSEDSNPIIRRAYELGATDYIQKPFDTRIVYRRVQNTINLYAKQRKMGSIVKNQVIENEKNNNMMIEILSNIVEFRNGESGLHVLHISKLVGLLLENIMRKDNPYHLTWYDCSIIISASALHDIGKIGIDEKILNKPGRLTNEEYEIMKQHTVIGANILNSLQIYQEEKLVQTAIEITRWHHERYDGRGYPDGLVGEQIPISAQVVSLADVYDALVSERVYKKGYSHEEAIHMILNGECGTFNPFLLNCLLEIQDTIKNEYEKEKENMMSKESITSHDVRSTWTEKMVQELIDKKIEM